MPRRKPDPRDDLVNPLRPWRSTLGLFLAAWVVVLLHWSGVTLPGRQHSEFEPIEFLFPFAIAVGYAAIWTYWRLNDERYRRRSRAMRRQATDPTKVSSRET